MSTWEYCSPKYEEHIYKLSPRFLQHLEWRVLKNISAFMRSDRINWHTDNRKLLSRRKVYTESSSGVKIFCSHMATKWKKLIDVKSKYNVVQYINISLK